jgi:hypothetical protein
MKYIYTIFALLILCCGGDDKLWYCFAEYKYEDYADYGSCICAYDTFDHASKYNIIDECRAINKYTACVAAQDYNNNPWCWCEPYTCSNSKMEEDGGKHCSCFASTYWGTPGEDIHCSKAHCCADLYNADCYCNDYDTVCSEGETSVPTCDAEYIVPLTTVKSCSE